MASPNTTVISAPYLDFFEHIIIITFSQFLNLSNQTGVSAADLNMSFSYYTNALDSIPGQDHYFILDTNYNVVYDSLSPIMLRQASITQIEFGVTRP